MDWTSYVPSVPFQLGKALYDKYKGSQSQDEAIKQRQDEALKNLNETGLASNQFAEYGQGGYQAMTGEAAQQRDRLRQLAEGKDSLSAEQLRQGLQQNYGAQRSMAASASPQNSAMAARTGAIQMGRLGAGMSGAAALAGIQERNAATQQLGSMIMGQRQQDLQAALGSRNNAVNAYGGVAGNPGMNTDDKRLQQLANMTSGGLSAAAAFSDERLKSDVEDGDDDANRAIKGLRAFTFNYKDEKHGKGKQVGVMAQAMEKAGLGHAVFDTPEGKAVHGAKAATSSLALVAALGRRVEKLEGKKKR
jgi:hypothetical protein